MDECTRDVRNVLEGMKEKEEEREKEWSEMKDEVDSLKSLLETVSVSFRRICETWTYGE